jgi:hypothetical protein
VVSSERTAKRLGQGARYLAAAVVILAVLVSCATAPKPAAGPGPTEVAAGGTKPATATQQGSQAASTGSTEVAALQKYLDDAYQKMDQGLVSEGILSFVTILSEVSRASSPSDDAKQFAKTAEEELTRIGSALSLTAGVEWMDADKNQVPGSTLDIGTPKARSPSVTVTYSYGGSKATVNGAPVVFEFAKGSGVLVTPVTTNEYGQANTTVTSLDSVKTENIVRATVSYRVKGYSYTFKGATRDFAYLPPVRKATILVLQRATFEDGKTVVSDDPVIANEVQNVLVKVDFQFTQYNGKLLGDQFSKVYGGDVTATKALGAELGVSYLVMVLSDCYYIKQVELNGKKYEIYKSKTNATTKIIRVDDGAILYSSTVQSIDGQANTPDKAAIDGFRNTATKAAEQLTGKVGEISKALVGG